MERTGHKYLHRELRNGKYVYFYKDTKDVKGQLAGLIDETKGDLKLIAGKYGTDPAKYPPNIKALFQKLLGKTEDIREKIDSLRGKKKTAPDKKEEKKEDGKYFNAKPSDVKNKGEDVWGAKRHKVDRTTYEKMSMEEMERKGVASGYVKKETLWGDIDLEEKQRLKRGETTHKIAMVYGIKDALKSKPSNDQPSRSLYYGFVKALEHADANSKTAGELESSIKNYLHDWRKKKLESAPSSDYRENFKFGATVNQGLNDNLGSVICKTFIGGRAFRDSDKVYALGSLSGWEASAKIGNTYGRSEPLKEGSYFHEAFLKFEEKKNTGMKAGDTVSFDPTTLPKWLVFDPAQHKKFAGQREAIQKDFKVKEQAYNTANDSNRDQRRQDYRKALDMVNTSRGFTLAIPKGKTAKIVKTEKGNPVIAVKDQFGNEKLIKMSHTSVKVTEVGERKHATTPDLVDTGKVIRKGGKNITGNAKSIQKYLTDQAGMRAVQYGNSMTDAEREYHTKKTAESFSDLADALQLPLKQVSFNGRLGMAFGARGRSKAMAHYEPDKKVINLTRNSGYGTIAHEWMHFVDNVVHQVYKQHASGHYMSTTDEHDFDPAYSHGAIPGTAEAGKKIKEISNYLSRQMMPTLKGYSEYWRRPKELVARSFEAFASDKIKSMGRENTYLVSDNKTKEKDANDVYPQGEVREKSNKMFAELFDILRTNNVLQKAMELVK